MSFDQAQRRPTFVLHFDDDYPGLEVHCRRPGFRPLRTLAEAVLVLGDDLDGRGLSGDDKLTAFEPLFTAFAQCVRRWNLVDEGRAVPLAALLDQDWEFLHSLARTWYREVVPGQRPQVLDHPQPVDEPVDGPEPDDEPGAHDQDGAVPPSPWGQPGTDEEWLGQFDTRTLPAPELTPDPADSELVDAP